MCLGRRSRKTHNYLLPPPQASPLGAANASAKPRSLPPLRPADHGPAAALYKSLPQGVGPAMLPARVHARPRSAHLVDLLQLYSQVVLLCYYVIFNNFLRKVNQLIDYIKVISYVVQDKK